MDNSLILTPNKVLAEKFLTIPAIYVPQMSDEDWELELDGTCRRALYTRQFLLGEISPDDFLDGLADTGVYVYNVMDYWEEGIALSDGFYEVI